MFSLSPPLLLLKLLLKLLKIQKITLFPPILALFVYKLLLQILLVIIKVKNHFENRPISPNITNSISHNDTSHIEKTDSQNDTPHNETCKNHANINMIHLRMKRPIMIPAICVPTPKLSPYPDYHYVTY